MLLIEPSRSYTVAFKHYCFLISKLAACRSLPLWKTIIGNGNILVMVNFMEIDDYVNFANNNPVSYIATTDGDQPRVRGLLLWFADKTGLYYNTGGTKDFYKQLKANPKVEACFFDTKSKSMQQMRVTGQAEFLDNLELKSKLIKARPFLKQWGLTPESPNLIVFRVAKCQAHFWTMETNLQPKQYVSFG